MFDPINKFAHRTLLTLTVAIAFAGVAAVSGNHQSVAAAQQTDNSGSDPADANMAPVDGSQPDNAQPQQNQDQQGQLPGSAYCATKYLTGKA